MIAALPGDSIEIDLDTICEETKFAYPLELKDFQPLRYRDTTLIVKVRGKRAESIGMHMFRFDSNVEMKGVKKNRKYVSPLPAINHGFELELGFAKPVQLEYWETKSKFKKRKKRLKVVIKKRAYASKATPNKPE